MKSKAISDDGEEEEKVTVTGAGHLSSGQRPLGRAGTAWGAGGLGWTSLMSAELLPGRVCFESSGSPCGTGFQAGVQVWMHFSSYSAFVGIVFAQQLP